MARAETLAGKLSCRCCCCAGLSVEEGGPWSPRESKGIRQDSDQVPWMVSVQSPFQQEQLEPESSLGLALWTGPAKGQGFLLGLLKASQPTRSDLRSLEVSPGLGAWLPLSPLLPMLHVIPQGQPRLSQARSCTPASTPLWVCLSQPCLYLCPEPFCLLPVTPLPEVGGWRRRQPEKQAEVWLHHPVSPFPTCAWAHRLPFEGTWSPLSTLSC